MNEFMSGMPRPDASPGTSHDAARAVLCCARSLSLASSDTLPRLHNLGARARLGRVSLRCARLLAELERAMEDSGWSPPAGAARRVDGTQRVVTRRPSTLQVGVGTDLGLLLELDVLAARLQARIEEVPDHGTPAEITAQLRSLSTLVRDIRSEYELYAA